MPMRNPFRRQTETAAPTLRERAAALREGLSRQDAVSGERADLYDRLLTAYAEDRAARPISGRDGNDAARRAANLVLNRTWALARDIVSMPPPTTLDGLRASALASAMLCEAESTTEDPTTVAAIGLTRAVLAVTGTLLPPGFVGFGDEPDYQERDRALFNPPGSLPAWAIAEIEAKDAADDDREATAEAHNDLPTAILDGWAAWGATNGRLGHEGTDEEYDAALAPMNRLAKLAEDLPATVENIPTKALACAWMEWVSSERPGQPRDVYGRADRLVYDLHVAIMARGSQEVTSQFAPAAFDFGPDAHIAELAAEFCEAYAANIKADREHMAERMPEAEWLPYYAEAKRLMKKLEATEPNTMLGMALKCLGPIGAAGYIAPADRSEVQEDAWDRLGTQFADAVLTDTLAPLPVPPPASLPAPRAEPDLVGMVDFSAASMSDLRALHDMANQMASVFYALAVSGRGCSGWPAQGSLYSIRFTPAGSLMQRIAEALVEVEAAAYREIMGRTPTNRDNEDMRLEIIARGIIENGDKAGTAAFARELLAMVEA